MEPVVMKFVQLSEIQTIDRNIRYVYLLREKSQQICTFRFLNLVLGDFSRLQQSKLQFAK